MKKLFLLFILLYCFGCNEEINPEPTIWLVLLDMSGMEDTKAVRKIYSENIYKVIESIKVGDRIVVGIISESSVNEPELLIDKRFEEFKPTTSNEFYTDAEKKKYNILIDSIKTSLKKNIITFLDTSSRIAQQTDLIGSLHFAENVFAKAGINNKKLVIFSDMEENRRYKFPSEELSKKRIEQIINQESTSVQGLPALNGVNVYIAGAHSKTNEKFFLVREFWLKFLKASGAEIAESDYNASALSLD